MIRIGSKLRKLFPGKSKVTARAGTFHHDEIRCRMVLSVPHPADDKCRFHRRNDRREDVYKRQWIRTTARHRSIQNLIFSSIVCKNIL